MNKIFNRPRRKRLQAIDPDEIFMDSSNLPGFDNSQFEGRIEKPISKISFIMLGFVFSFVILVFSAQTWNVQITQGEEYSARSENNKLRNTLLFSDRGIIYDRNDGPLAWNEHRDDMFNTRKYTENPGFSNLLGYVSYPKRDSAGFFYDESIEGVDGIEKNYNDLLSGKNGKRIIEVNVKNEIFSENEINVPQNGANINLTIDSDLQKKMFESLETVVTERGFAGGGAVIMDIHNGDILSLVSYPQFDSNVMTDGKDAAKIAEFVNDERNPFLNKITEGNYTPGSIVKPFMAAAALQEGIIKPTDKIISRGTLVVPNPYNPDNPSVFTDWKAHGVVNVREALAVSSNIFFYIIGGGFDDMPGLGITKIEEYFKKFGFGKKMENDIWSGSQGLIPNPEWKKQTFDDDWRLGDTYFTSIGQYGFQVVPIQVIRAISAIANNGLMIEPNLILDHSRVPIMNEIEGIDSWVYKIIQEGMKDAVEFGTARGLFYPDFNIAAKTGTAELGVSKGSVNSWAVGYWPYENPKYAFTIFLEKGDRHNTIGGVAVARNFFDWLKFNKEEYLGN